jgi:hypothetical protein
MIRIKSQRLRNRDSSVIYFKVITIGTLLCKIFFRNNLVKTYIGESRISEALGLGSSGKNCSDYYSRDVCPWDTSAMIKIASKVMSSGWT